MYMDIKQFAKSEKELKTQVRTVRIYSKNIGMEFGKEKWTILIMRSGKRQMTETRELPNQEKIRALRDMETYKYLGILEADTIRLAEMNEEIKKEYLRLISKLLETK